MSLPGGDARGEEYIVSYPTTEIIRGKAQKVVRRVSGCGIDGQITNSSWVKGLRHNLGIVLLDPDSSASSPAGELKAAQNCGLTDYTKLGIRDV